MPKRSAYSLSKREAVELIEEMVTPGFLGEMGLSSPKVEGSVLRMVGNLSARLSDYSIGGSNDPAVRQRLALKVIAKRLKRTAADIENNLAPLIGRGR